MCGVLHGLHAAHEARSENDEPLGIVHRDVSPQNILVGCDGVARVLDFGIARGAGRQHLTREGQIRGKMAYLTPEILKGREVDRRADVYSVSVVLWEALTGARLFQAPNDAVVLAKVLSGEVVPLRAVAPHLSEGLEAIVMKGLERDPEKRFSTAREMALALQQEVGLLASCEIGDWVRELAEPTLAERSRQVIEMERSSGIYPHEGWSTPLPGSAATSEYASHGLSPQDLGRFDGSDEPRTSPSVSRRSGAPQNRGKALLQSIPFRIGAVVVLLGICAVVFARPLTRMALRSGRPKLPAKMAAAPTATAPVAPTTPTLAASIGWIGSTAEEPPPPVTAPAAHAPAAPAAEARPAAAKKAPPVRHRPVARPRRPAKEKEEPTIDEGNTDGF
jgi:serine/threonine-protein kinase